ncbi:MAG TPA: polysaccharide deacetylase family protein, partial [Thermomicrobiales bacterium]|nr:polysaccharide deacetylase family protein [Thermomicrobiales bacterium]
AVTQPATPPPTVAGPGPQKEMATRSASAIPELATLSQVRPNELGGVPIIMYHAFVHDIASTDEWTLTFDQFREQLDWFRENDFVMVGMQSMIDGRFDVPAGKRPIILTFDDSSAGQFGLQEAPGGGYEVKPDTAVGVLEEYARQYPEFAGPAFFAVLPWNCFESEGDPSSCEERLNWLIDHGYEVGNHTYDHVDMTDVSSEFFAESIGSMKQWINERIPQGPGNLSDVLVMPFGAFPDRDLHPDQRSWLAEGFWYMGEPVNLDLVLAVNGGPAFSPYSVSFYPAETFRIASEPGVLGYWQEQITSGESLIFESDGDPDTVTVPASYQDAVDTGKLQSKGLELRVYADE